MLNFMPCPLKAATSIHVLLPAKKLKKVNRIQSSIVKPKLKNRSLTFQLSVRSLQKFKVLYRQPRKKQNLTSSASKHKDLSKKKSLKMKTGEKEECL